ncbi:ABC transporter ATP-binding protein [Magnetospirillum sp. J10]|uniref:ABC transporter ATP-binding protein n=1 Tax=Magnetospirillum sulfuroxidans TaxID=611300 RepID=A0ABS5IFE6_9PROT|nr:ABC transporter ATP-binding protein [Magnetospirillum sulfuroxidans]
MFHLDRVSFSYESARPVLDQVDFTLAAGERVALCGANGSGKTTLFHLMVGLRVPCAGRIVAFGRERRKEADFHDVRAQAGLLFQDSDDQLFCPTVAEDVAFGPLNLGKSRAQARDAAARALALVGLAGFDDRVTHKLSGGQKRLVALASVLAMEPKVLLLDEPTNGLDREARARLLQVLAELPQAMVIIAHDDEALTALTQRRVNLEAGRLLG